MRGSISPLVFHCSLGRIAHPALLCTPLSSSCSHVHIERQWAISVPSAWFLLLFPPHQKLSSVNQCRRCLCPLSWRFSRAYLASFPFHRPNQMISGTTLLVSTMPWKCICQHNTSKSGPSASPWIECFLLDPPFVVKVPQSPYMSHSVLWDSFFLPLHHRPEPHLSVLPFQYCSSPSFLPIFTIQVPAQTSRVWTFAIAFFGLISLSCFSPAKSEVSVSPAKSEVSVMPCPCLLNGFTPPQIFSLIPHRLLNQIQTLQRVLLEKRTKQLQQSPNINIYFKRRGNAFSRELF